MSENQVESIESHQYGELWPDGTFKMLSNYTESAWHDFARRLRADYQRVPEALRPVFATRKISTTTETFPPEEISA
jgi:hypothetical protein